MGAGIVGATVGMGVGGSVGAGVRGAGVNERVGDGLGEGDGLVDGAASGWDEITAAPRRSSAMSAIAAKTVKTVDQRSAGGRSPGIRASGGGMSCSVLSTSVDRGRSSTFDASARAVPNGPLVGRPPKVV